MALSYQGEKCYTRRCWTGHLTLDDANPPYTEPTTSATFHPIPSNSIVLLTPEMLQEFLADPSISSGAAVDALKPPEADVDPASFSPYCWRAFKTLKKLLMIIKAKKWGKKRRRKR